MATAKLETRIRREQIVHAALGVVASDGLRRLSVARVARRVGLVPSALYRHFVSKDEIVDAVVCMVQERLAENARAAREESTGAIERLHSLLNRHLRLIIEHPGLPRLMFSEDVYAGRPGRRAEMFALIRAYLDRIAALVRDGQKEGEIAAGLDPRTVALLFLGLVQPVAILSQVSDGTFDVTGQAQKTWRLFADAIRSR